MDIIQNIPSVQEEVQNSISDAFETTNSSLEINEHQKQTQNSFQANNEDSFDNLMNDIGLEIQRRGGT